MTFNYDVETKPFLTVNGEEAICFCNLCGRMYTKRPMLCLCRSNVFLRDIEMGKSHLATLDNVAEQSSG